jgi:hypothetical protein
MLSALALIADIGIRSHVAAYVHAAGVPLEVTAEQAGCGSTQAGLKLEHLVPAERKAFRHSFCARMRAKFSQQRLDVEFHGVQRDVQTARRVAGGPGCSGDPFSSPGPL